ncbi:hypothetical protein SODALDRAFT_355748 [Sodiomyces alkalinus F11]|uniref:Uncharacterized protein n=1 Tax=Sodiomyces alkalinus (strain CBS 110278 / VKM F-3762 / F11) TaxID=1314773 RepID=A0A3N2QA61_SODAK|nr:hypothetical protein SODALDRAFT_355748 [Sodiomyces alkalinus F11]ROT43535.1 hypothetical protein SODALDRAFT_355748 [Sodiomyces alkalinus F11]
MGFSEIKGSPCNFDFLHIFRNLANVPLSEVKAWHETSNIEIGSMADTPEKRAMVRILLYTYRDAFAHTLQDIKPSKSPDAPVVFRVVYDFRDWKAQGRAISKLGQDSSLQLINNLITVQHRRFRSDQFHRFYQPPTQSIFFSGKVFIPPNFPPAITPRGTACKQISTLNGLASSDSHILSLSDRPDLTNNHITTTPDHSMEWYPSTL